MAIPAMIAALAIDWERVAALLDQRGRTKLNELVVAMADAETEDLRTDFGSKIAYLLFEALPPEDPVVVVGRRLATDVQASEYVPSSVAITLRGKVGGTEPWPAERRILSAPWESATSLRKRGIDPDIPDLIRLDREDGSYAVPTFQFDPHGRPLDLVLRVNQVLGAYHDPWGVADWWLSRNVWLHDRPAMLLGRSDEVAMLAAAVAVVEG